MPRRPSQAALSAVIRAAVPAVFSRQRYAGVFANLLLFTVVALAGEWTVHQLEYLIEYGSQFNAVMASTPHRLYMSAEGLALGFVLLVLLSGVAWFLSASDSWRRALIARLPQRLQPLVPAYSLVVPARLLLQTALALAGVQCVLYLLQENLELVSLGAGAPGLAVVVAPQHATVTPLFWLAAMAGSILLRTLSHWIDGARQSVAVAKALVSLRVARASAPIRLPLPLTHIPNFRIIAGVLGLRSPPRMA